LGGRVLNVLGELHRAVAEIVMADKTAHKSNHNIRRVNILAANRRTFRSRQSWNG
jgi:hypothetical protein